jgi:hypothetical protein
MKGCFLCAHLGKLITIQMERRGNRRLEVSVDQVGGQMLGRD